MTPKEKALQLYNQYEFVYIQNYTSKHEVKQCAIICVEEIMNADPCRPSSGVYVWEDFKQAYKYWQSVKTEIEKL